jgi:hypothetical protein
MTAVVDVRFDCSADELRSFLMASPLLQEDLEVGRRAVGDRMGLNTVWWQPGKLTSVSGFVQSWETANGRVAAHLMCGEAAEPGRVTVYLAMTKD